MLYNIPLYAIFSKCPRIDIFFTSLSISPQDLTQNKNKKKYLNNSKNNTILKQLEVTFSLCNTCPV